MYYYRIFDLIVASEVFLPEAAAAEAGSSPDVTITAGDLEHDITRHSKTKSPGGIWHYCFPEEGVMWFRVSGIDFEVSGGNRIVADTHGRDFDEQKMRTYLLGTAFGVINMQRGHIPIHGAAVETQDGAVIISGSSGAGKTTVLSALLRKGYKYLADDVSVVMVENGKAEVVAAYPMHKIDADLESGRGYVIKETEIFVEEGRRKYSVCDPSEWRADSMELARIVVLVPVRREGGEMVTPEIKRVQGHAALQVVMRNLYRMPFYEENGISPEIMKKILRIAADCEIYSLIRPEAGSTPEELAEMIFR